MRMDVPEPIYVKTVEEAKKWAEYYGSLDTVGFDTETTGLHYTQDKIKFFSFACDTTRIAAPVLLLRYFKGVLENPKIAKCMSNSKFDIHMAANHKISIKGFLWDTVTMSRIQDASRLQHGLKGTAELADIRMLSFQDVFGAKMTEDNAVKMMCQMYRALHVTQSPEDCLDLLVLVESVEEPRKDFLKDYAKLVMYREAGVDTIDYKKILNIARRHGYATKTSGEAGFVKDWSDLIGLPYEFDGVSDRRALKHLTESNEMKEAALYICLDRMLSELNVVDPMKEIEDRVCEYASLDAWASFQLAKVFKELLEDVEDPVTGKPLLEYYTTYCSDFLRALWTMERNGITIDLNQIHSVKAVMDQEIQDAEREITKIAAKERGSAYAMSFNPGSTKQLIDYYFENRGTDDDPVWYDKFGSKVRKLTKAGSPSCDEKTLVKFSEVRADDMATAILEFRKKTKVTSTYLKPLSERVDTDGRIRTSFVDFGAVTGRIASREPNLMNIPKKGDAGKLMRKMFIAKPGHKLIVADYSALEMRLMAHFSGDPRMIDAIHQGLDLHCYTAAMAQGYDYDEMYAAKKAANPTAHQEELLRIREFMKTIGYGLLYGIQEVKLGTDLGLEVITVQGHGGRSYQKCPEAKELMDQYFRVFPGVVDYINNTHNFCRDNLFVRTFAGRHIHKPDIISSKPWIVNAAKRQAQNAIIQGTGADIVNMAMIKTIKSRVFKKLGVELLLQVHDELVYEVPDNPDTIEKAMKEVRNCMENPFRLKVPITVEMDCADNWGDAK